MAERLDAIVSEGCRAWGVDTDGSDYEHHHVARAAIEACVAEVEAAGCNCNWVTTMNRGHQKDCPIALAAKLREMGQ